MSWPRDRWCAEINRKNRLAKRLEQNKAVLFEHLEHGYRAMPPKGACLECSNNDLHATLDYLLKKIEALAS